MAAFVGDTVRLRSSFYNFAGELADPTSVTITIYDGDKVVLVNAGATTKESTGIYYYDYTVPSTSPDPLVYEFSGTLESHVSLSRATINRKWV